MMENQDILDKIDAYLNGRLSKSDAFAFEQELASNKELAQEVELEKIINASVIDHQMMDWDKEIKASFKKEKQENQLKNALYIAIPCVLALTAFLFFNNKEEKVDARKDFEKVEISVPKKVESKTSVPLKSIKKEDVSVEEKNVGVTSPAKVIVDNKKSESRIELQGIDYKSIKVEGVPQEVKPKEKLSIKQDLAQNPCENVVLSANVSANGTCANKSEGQIALSETKGGTAPYQYKIEGRNWSGEAKFDALFAGNYTITIKDKMSCETKWTKKVVVQEILCYQPEIGFNPNYETWEYKADWGKPVVITIRNKAAQVVFQQEVEADFVWDGKDNNGQLLPSALYIYTISGDKIHQGSVTITY